MSETISEKSRAEVNKIVVTEGEDVGRVQDIDVAQNTAKLLDFYRNDKKAGSKIDPEREAASQREYVDHRVANEVMNRVVTRPQVEEDKNNGVRTGIGYHPEVSSEDLGQAYNAAIERQNEINKIANATREAHENGAEFLDLSSNEFSKAFAEAPVYRKSTIVRARLAEPGEVVVTVTPDGVEEGRNTASEGDHVVTGANGADFILPAEKFNKLYEETEEAGTFQAKGMARIIDNPTGKKIGILAPWGEMQYGDAEAKLAVQYDPENPDVIGTDRYVLDSNEFAVYKEV